jgi:hypothetical protein
MSLAMFAAPFNDNQTETVTNDADNLINKKRQTHNKTQKIYPKENFDSDKVNSVLEKIHNNSRSDDDDDSSNLDNFNPPPKPQSAGVNKTISTENMMNMNSQNNQTNLMFKTLGHAPQPIYSTDNLELNDYSNYGNEKTNAEYYKQLMSGYNPVKNPVNKPYYNLQNYVSETHSEDVLLQKLNYMISLLEEQQDEKTSNVTEEVILYSFLGIFIIFIVDSFARVGKYVR